MRHARPDPSHIHAALAGAMFTLTSTLGYARRVRKRLPIRQLTDKADRPHYPLLGVARAGRLGVLRHH